MRWRRPAPWDYLNPLDSIRARDLVHPDHTPVTPLGGWEFADNSKARYEH